MADSESQFQDLIAHLSVRVNKMLSQQDLVHPLCLKLLSNGEVETSIVIADNGEQMRDAVNAMISLLSEAVEIEPIDATCIAFPSYETQAVTALLENRDNYCATCTIPVVADPALRVDLENVDIADGEIYIFPILDDE